MLDTLMFNSLEGPSYQEFRAEDAVTRCWFGGQRKRHPEFRDNPQSDLDD